MSIPHPNAPKPSGISNGAIPASRRADGSLRKEIKVRPGFTPQEDVARYRSPRVARKLGHEPPPSADDGANGLAGLGNLLRRMNVTDERKAVPPGTTVPAGAGAAPAPTSPVKTARPVPTSPKASKQPIPTPPSPVKAPDSPPKPKKNWRTGKGSSASIYAPAALKEAVVAAPLAASVAPTPPTSAPQPVAPSPATATAPIIALKPLQPTAPAFAPTPPASPPKPSAPAPHVAAPLPRAPAPSRPSAPPSAPTAQSTAAAAEAAASKPAPTPARKTSWGVHLRTSSWADEVDSDLSDPEPLAADSRAATPTQTQTPFSSASSQPSLASPTQQAEKPLPAAPVQAVRKTSWGVHLRTSSWADEVDELSDPEFDDPPPPAPARAPNGGSSTAPVNGVGGAAPGPKKGRGGKGRSGRKKPAAKKDEPTKQPSPPSAGAQSTIKGRGGAGKMRGWDD